MQKQEKYDLYHAFDIEKHKQTYTNYLEVIIRPSGMVQYAVPSHQEKLIRLGMEKYGLSREEFEALVPREYWCDYLTWLCKTTGCVAVWNGSICGRPNRFQRKKLQLLKREGLYRGEV